MFNRRFVPYIVGVCIVALISLSYVGYRAYQNHVEFERLIADAQEGFNRSVDGHHSHSSEAPRMLAKDNRCKRGSRRCLSLVTKRNRSMMRQSLFLREVLRKSRQICL